MKNKKKKNQGVFKGSFEINRKNLKVTLNQGYPIWAILKS